MKRELTAFEERVAEVMAEEAKEPLRWWYLSFAGEKFNGGAILYAHGITHARLILGKDSPRGEIYAIPIPDDMLPPVKYRNRVLSKEEIQEFWPDAKTIREFDAEQAEAPREEEREMKVIGTIGRLSEVILGEESGEYYAIVPLRNRKGETFNEAWKRIKKKFAPRKKKAEAPRG